MEKGSAKLPRFNQGSLAFFSKAVWLATRAGGENRAAEAVLWPTAFAVNAAWENVRWKNGGMVLGMGEDS